MSRNQLWGCTQSSNSSGSLPSLPKPISGENKTAPNTTLGLPPAASFRPFWTSQHHYFFGPLSNLGIPFLLGISISISLPDDSF